MTSVLREPEKTQRHGEDSNVKTEAEIRVMWPQAKENQEPPEDGRGKEESPPTAFGGSVNPLTLWCQTLGLQDCGRIYTSVVLSHDICGNLFQQETLTKPKEKPS